MPLLNLLIGFFAAIGRAFLGLLQATGALSIFAAQAVMHIVVPPLYPGELLRQLMRIGYFSLPVVGDVCRSTLKTTAMVFFILIGASIFSLVFRGYGGDELVHGWFVDMPGGVWGAFAIVMLVIMLYRPEGIWPEKKS